MQIKIQLNHNKMAWIMLYPHVCVCVCASQTARACVQTVSCLHVGGVLGLVVFAEKTHQANSSPVKSIGLIPGTETVKWPQQIIIEGTRQNKDDSPCYCRRRRGRGAWTERRDSPGLRALKALMRQNIRGNICKNEWHYTKIFVFLSKNVEQEILQNHISSKRKSLKN